MIQTRKKEKSLAVLEKELDGVFSDFIRLRDSDNGVVKCFVCGASAPWKQAQNGHYIPRAKMPTRYDEMNCNGICEACNVYDTKHEIKYGEAMVRKYGTQAVFILRAISRGLQKFMRSDLIEKIEHYKVEVSKLRKSKSL